MGELTPTGAERSCIIGAPMRSAGIAERSVRDMAFVSDASKTGSKPSEVMRSKQSGAWKSISGAEIGKRELVCNHDVCRMFSPNGRELTEADEETAVQRSFAIGT